jgi:hypothetical protein
VPPEPEVDGVCVELLQAYQVISRGRRYIGMIGQPAALSHRDISAHLLRFPTAISLEEYETAIFALDDEYRAVWASEHAPRAKE